MRLIDADKLFEQVGNIKPNNKQQYEDIGMFMEMITNSSTVADKCETCQFNKECRFWRR